MKEIEDYMIVSGDVINIISIVKEFISSGWVPIGGVTINSDMTFAYQTMVKYK